MPCSACEATSLQHGLPAWAPCLLLRSTGFWALPWTISGACVTARVHVEQASALSAPNRTACIVSDVGQNPRWRAGPDCRYIMAVRGLWSGLPGFCGKAFRCCVMPHGPVAHVGVRPGWIRREACVCKVWLKFFTFHYVMKIVDCGAPWSRERWSWRVTGGTLDQRRGSVRGR